MNAYANIDWEYRRKVILDVQAANGTPAEAAERLGLELDTMLRTARKMKLPFPPQQKSTAVDRENRRRVICEVQAIGGTAKDAAERLGLSVKAARNAAISLGIPFSQPIIDWNRRGKVIIEVQKSGGTAKDAAERLGIKTDTVLKTARKLGVRFPSNNGYHNRTQRAKPIKPNAGQEQSKERLQTTWTAYHQRRRFASAMERAPEQHLSDAELVEKAIAQGKLTKVPGGSGLVPQWLFGITDNCVKPRPGASKGGRAAP